VVDDYSRYAWVFFLEDKSETFGFVQDLIVRLKNERQGMLFELSAVIMAQSSRTLVLMPFVVIKVLNISIRPLMWPLKMELWKGKIGLFARWLGRCSMSTGLLGGIGLRRSIRLVMFPTGFYCELSRRRPVMSLCMVGLPR
jgi:hypothetical protein